MTLVKVLFEELRPAIDWDTVLKFCLQFVLQNVLMISWFPADFCCAEQVNG
jgi:hypothetical protein